ncbi:MAG: SDR family oxidoreductase [Galbitalea sp.]
MFLTGGTGFLGQAVLERLLSDHPGTRVTLLIRKKGSTPAADRLRTLLRKPVFSIWRGTVGDEGVELAIKDRLRVVESGLGPLPALPKDLDIVIHSASTVSFDPPIDQAFDTNVGGAVGLYEALLAAGGDPARRARVDRVRRRHPQGHRARGRSHPRCRLAGGIRGGQGARAPASRWRRANPTSFASSSTPRVPRTGKEGPQAVAKYAEAARVEWVQALLIDYGRTRAESLG